MMTINKKQISDAKNFEAMCAEIESQEELDSLKLKDEKVHALLNEYFSREIYPRFAFIAQANDKSDALSCLNRLKYYKSVVLLCGAVESFKLPESPPHYLAHDFRIKIDYINDLIASGGIANESALAGFEAVVKSLRALYEEKNRHEATFLSIVNEFSPGEQIKSPPRKPREKKSVKSPEIKPGAANKKEKSRPKKVCKEKEGAAPKAPESDTVKSAGRTIGKAEKKILKKVYKEKASKAPKDIEFYIVFISAIVFMIAGAAIYARGDKASTFGAFIGGAFGAFFGSLIVDTIFFTKMEYFIRDAAVCLFLMALAASLFILNIY
jgi:hypothetical protein